MYLWVEKIQKIELRHYGTRMMIEFHIPEPAVSLLESTAGASTRRRLPQFDIGPSDVDGTNYMCLAQRYGAVDVEPPPVRPSVRLVSTTFTSINGGDQLTDTVNVPAGYRPEWRGGLVGPMCRMELRAQLLLRGGGISEAPATRSTQSTPIMVSSCRRRWTT